MGTLVIPFVGMQLLVAIPGTLVLEQLRAVFALEGQVFSVALKKKKQKFGKSY